MAAHKPIVARIITGDPDNKGTTNCIKFNKEAGSYGDLRPKIDRTAPANNLSGEERRLILDTVNKPEYASMPPCEIVPHLADQGIYIASESAFYRVLREEKMLNHRGRADAPSRNHPTTYSADGPNQVWMWDITYLNGPHKGMVRTKSRIAQHDNYTEVLIVIDNYLSDRVYWMVNYDKDIYPDK